MNKPALLFCNYRADASITASVSEPGYLASDVLIHTEDTYHKLTATGSSENYIIDFGETRAFSCLAILGANLNGVKVDVRASVDAEFTSPVILIEEVTLESSVNAAWVKIVDTPVSYRFVKIIFYDYPNNMRISNLCVTNLLDFPYLATDYDQGNAKPTGAHLVSSAGYYIGSSQQKSMKELTIDFGQVIPADYTNIATWADNSLANFKPYFFVPDIDESTVYFGWSEGGFSAPLQNALYNVKPIKMTTRSA